MFICQFRESFCDCRSDKFLRELMKDTSIVSQRFIYGLIVPKLVHPVLKGLYRIGRR